MNLRFRNLIIVLTVIVTTCLFAPVRIENKEVLSSSAKSYSNPNNLNLYPSNNNLVTTFYQKIVVTKPQSSSLNLANYKIVLSPNLGGWSYSLQNSIEFTPLYIYAPNTQYIVKVVDKSNANVSIASWIIKSPAWTADIALLNTIQHYKLTNYPLDQYLPKDTPFYSIAYSAPRVLTVKSTKLPAYIVEERKKDEVQRWIASKGIAPSTHTLKWESTVQLVPGFKPWTQINATIGNLGNFNGQITSFNAGYDKNGNYIEAVAKGGRMFQKVGATGTWTEVTQNFDSAGTIGTPLLSFHPFRHPVTSVFKQRVVRAGKVYERENINNSWSQWQNVTAYFEKIGNIVAPVEDFSSFVSPYGYIVQRTVKNGVLYQRDNAIGWNQWTNVTSALNLPTSCQGQKLTGMSSFKDTSGRLTQYTVVDGKVCKRVNY